MHQDVSLNGFFVFHGNRQGALADGLHGLNPRITAHRYTPVQKANSVDCATVKASGTTVEQGQMYKRSNPSCALGAFCVFIHLRVWRGKEEMALSTLGELWSKGNELNMDKCQAHALLNQVKLGLYVSQANIKEALFTTGDLDVLKIETRVDRALRIDGPQSCYSRTREVENSGIGEGFSWSLEWDRKRNSNQIAGIEK